MFGFANFRCRVFVFVRRDPIIGAEGRDFDRRGAIFDDPARRTNMKHATPQFVSGVDDSSDNKTFEFRSSLPISGSKDHVTPFRVDN